MLEIIKTCKTHGALTINDVYIRNTRKGMDCKWCSKECAERRRLANPEKFKEHGRKYRHIEVPEDTIERRCSGCKKIVHKDLFTLHAWKRRHPRCKPCTSISAYKSKIKNQDTYKAYRERASAISRKSYLRRTWNISIEQFNALRDLQEGKCAICKIESKVMHIDHNHATGKIRALLCNNCNRGIGHLKESSSIMLAAIEYLKLHDG